MIGTTNFFSTGSRRALLKSSALNGTSWAVSGLMAKTVQAAEAISSSVRLIVQTTACVTRLASMTNRLFFLLLFLVLFAPELRGQTAELSGIVKDPAGAAVPNASIEVLNQDTGIHQQTTSNSDGLYSLPSLKPGNYTVTVQMSGFRTLTRGGIVVQLGTAAEQITVSGDAPQINTTDGSISTVVDRQFVENMPLNGRSFQSLVALVPGVSIVPSADTGDQGQFSVAGNRAGANYFTIDGVSANFGVSNGTFQGQTNNGGLVAFSALGSTNSLVSVDALQEFRLETSTYAPEFGRESGAQAVLVTRSGTNSFHGDLFEYFRNDKLDANDWFANRDGLPKSRERQNDFGGVVGGPIIKDKTFFFFSYEGLRSRQPKVFSVDVPSLAARAAAVGSRQALLNAFPLPNGPDTNPGLSLLNASYSDVGTLDAYSLRFDHQINSKLTLFGRLNHSPSLLEQRSEGCGSSLNTICHKKVTLDTATVGLTALLSRALTNDFRFNYSRARGGIRLNIDNLGGAVVPSTSALFAPFDSPVTSLSGVGFAGYGRNVSLAQGVLTHHLNRQLNVNDTVALTRGTHQFKFGFDFRRMTPIGVLYQSAENSYWYGTVNDIVSGKNPDFVAIDQNPNSLHFSFHNFSSFAQDTWKASDRLTLTYGVRWDYNPPPTETTGHNLPCLSEITDLATATLLPPGCPLWHATKANVAPRVGLSYRLRKSTNHMTVLRTGFGTFYDIGTNTAGFQDADDGWYPFSLQTTLCSPGGAPCPYGFPYDGPQPTFAFTPPYNNMRAFDPHLKLPRTYEWNLAIEQTLSPNQTFKVTYLGSAGRNLLRDDIVHNPNPTFSYLMITRNTSFSNYHALELQFERRLSHGLQALVSYSWSHSLDLNSADVTSAYGGPVGIPSNFFNLKQEYGNSDFDIRNVFSAAVTYDIPGEKLGSRPARYVLGRWAIDGLVSARSSTWFSVLYDPSLNGGVPFLSPYGSYIDFRPDRVPGQPFYISDSASAGGKRINPAAFAIPSLLGQGNEGRNIVPAFPLTEIDLSLRRQFDFGERFKLHFRIDGFNIINHANFGTPSNNLGLCALGVPQCATTNTVFGQSIAMLNQSMGVSGTYGSAFSSLYQIGGPRSFQVSMKFQF